MFRHANHVGSAESPGPAPSLRDRAQPRAFAGPSSRRDTQLLHHRHVVHDSPVLGHEAVGDPEHVDPGHVDAPSRCGDAHEAALVRPRHTESAGCLLPLDHGVLDSHRQVGERSEQAPEHLRDPVPVAVARRYGEVLMLDEVVRDQAEHPLGVLGVHGVIEVPDDIWHVGHGPLLCRTDVVAAREAVRHSRSATAG